MRDILTFLVRNPAYVTRNARATWAVRKAMKAHRERSPFCAYTGKTTALHVHHIRPVSTAPELAAEPSNLMTLNADAHLHVAHAGNWKSCVPNIREVCAARLIQRTRAHS